MSYSASIFRERVTLPGADVVTDLGGGAVEVTPGAGVNVRAGITEMRGQEALQNRQTMGGIPYEIVLRWPLPDGYTLTHNSTLTWLSPRGSVTLHLTTPPALTQDRRYLRFTAVEKADA